MQAIAPLLVTQCRRIPRMIESINIGIDSHQQFMLNGARCAMPRHTTNPARRRALRSSPASSPGAWVYCVTPPSRSRAPYLPPPREGEGDRDGDGAGRA